MHIWLVSLGLIFISFAYSVRSSERCYHDWDCSHYGHGDVCCSSGFCKLKKFCERCSGDQDCSSGKKCVANGLCYESDSNNYYCDGENARCLEGHVCEDGKCVSTTSRPPLMGSKLIETVIIVFVSVVLVIFIIYCLYKRDKKRTRDRVLATRNAWRTTLESRESVATAPTTVTEVDMQIAGAGVSNGGFVIDLEQTSLPLPPDAPPPYSSLEFQQQRDDSNDTEQPPPTYDEAVKNCDL